MSFFNIYLSMTPQISVKNQKTAVKLSIRPMEKMAVLRLPCPCGTGDQIKSALQYVPQLFAAL